MEFEVGHFFVNLLVIQRVNRGPCLVYPEYKALVQRLCSEKKKSKDHNKTYKTVPLQILFKISHDSTVTTQSNHFNSENLFRAIGFETGGRALQFLLEFW